MTFLIDVAVLGFAAVAVILALEFVLRKVIAAGGYYVRPPGQVVRINVNAQALPKCSRHICFKTNELGERGPELPTHGTLFRIVVAGGSAAECYFLDQEEAWSSVLQSTLATPQNLAELKREHVHVGNIARSGVNAETLSVMLPYVLEQRRSIDLLILMIGASDVLQWLGTGAPDSVLPNQPSMNELFARHPQHRFSLWPLKRTAAYEVARRGRQKLAALRTKHVGTSIERQRKMRAAADCVKQIVPDPGGMIANFKRHLLASIETCHAARVPVLLVCQPWYHKEEVSDAENACFWNGAEGESWRSTIRTYYSHEVICALMRMIDSAVLDVSRRTGAPTLDVKDDVEPTLDNYYDQLHFTPAGSRIVGRAVGDAVLRLLRDRRLTSLTRSGRCIAYDDLDLGHKAKFDHMIGTATTGVNVSSEAD